MLSSGAPPVATLRANERVISHWLGALVPSMFMRSPSRDWKGFPDSPGSGGVIPSCYGEESPPVSAAVGSPNTAEAVWVVPPSSKVIDTQEPGGSA